MLFRQLFDNESITYTYLLADPRSGEALLVDPVLEAVPGYSELMDQLDLKLISAVDTHVHADHITGLGELRAATECATVMGEHSRAECVSRKLGEGGSAAARRRVFAGCPLHSGTHRRIL